MDADSTALLLPKIHAIPNNCKKVQLQETSNREKHYSFRNPLLPLVCFSSCLEFPGFFSCFSNRLMFLLSTFPVTITVCQEPKFQDVWWEFKRAFHSTHKGWTNIKCESKFFWLFFMLRLLLSWKNISLLPEKMTHLPPTPVNIILWRWRSM